jgi:hypothetical protein
MTVGGQVLFNDFTLDGSGNQSGTFKIAGADNTATADGGARIQFHSPAGGMITVSSNDVFNGAKINTNIDNLNLTDAPDPTKIDGGAAPFIFKLQCLGCLSGSLVLEERDPTSGNLVRTERVSTASGVMIKIDTFSPDGATHRRNRIAGRTSSNQSDRAGCDRRCLRHRW